MRKLVIITIALAFHYMAIAQPDVPGTYYHRRSAGT